MPHEETDHEQEELLELAEDYRATFDTPFGKRVLEDLKDGFYDRIYVPDPDSRCADAEAHFKNGERSVLLYIMQQLRTAEEYERVKGESDYAG